MAKNFNLDTLISDSVETSLTDLYSCDRCWSAWSYNTMSEDDFYPANEDEDIIQDVKDSIMKLSFEKLEKNTDKDSEIYFLENWLTDQCGFDVYAAIINDSEIYVFYEGLNILQCPKVPKLGYNDETLLEAIAVTLKSYKKYINQD